MHYCGLVFGAACWDQSASLWERPASLEAARLLSSVTGDCGCTPLAPDSVCCRAFASGAGCLWAAVRDCPVTSSACALGFSWCSGSRLAYCVVVGMMAARGLLRVCICLVSLGGFVVCISGSQPLLHPRSVSHGRGAIHAGRPGCGLRGRRVAWDRSF